VGGFDSLGYEWRCIWGPDRVNASGIAAAIVCFSVANPSGVGGCFNQYIGCVFIPTSFIQQFSMLVVCLGLLVLIAWFGILYNVFLGRMLLGTCVTFIFVFLLFGDFQRT